MHHHHILHRDLKSDNIFITSENVAVIGDFGWSKESVEMRLSLAGTPLYMSPEQLKHESYNEKADIYSLGCLLFELCTLHHPFIAAQNIIQLSRMQQSQFPFGNNFPSAHNTPFAGLISKCMSYKSKDRPSIDDIYNNPVIQQYINNSIFLIIF